LQIHKLKVLKKLTDVIKHIIINLLAEQQANIEVSLGWVLRGFCEVSRWVCAVKPTVFGV